MCAKFLVAALAVAVLGFGLYPGPLLEAIDASVTCVVEQVASVSVAGP